MRRASSFSDVPAFRSLRPSRYFAASVAHASKHSRDTVMPVLPRILYCINPIHPADLIKSRVSKHIVWRRRLPKRPAIALTSRESITTGAPTKTGKAQGQGEPWSELLGIARKRPGSKAPVRGPRRTPL